MISYLMGVIAALPELGTPGANPLWRASRTA